MRIDYCLIIFKMISFLRLRGSFLLLVLGLVIILSSLICFASGAVSGGSRQKKISLVLPKPYVSESRRDNNYYGRNSDADYYENADRIAKRSTRSPPTSDDDYNMEHRRGVMDSNGRTLIFKSLILAPLLLVVIILLIVAFIPIPVISSPLGRSLPSTAFPSHPSFSSSIHTLKMAREVLTSEECIERVSCELSKISRSYDSTSWIPLTMEKLLTKSKWGERIIRGIKGTSPSACTQFTCTPAKNLKRTLKNAVVAQ